MTCIVYGVHLKYFCMKTFIFKKCSVIVRIILCKFMYCTQTFYNFLTTCLAIHFFWKKNQEISIVHSLHYFYESIAVEVVAVVVLAKDQVVVELKNKQTNKNVNKLTNKNVNKQLLTKTRFCICKHILFFFPILHTISIILLISSRLYS